MTKRLLRSICSAGGVSYLLGGGAFPPAAEEQNRPHGQKQSRENRQKKGKGGGVAAEEDDLPLGGALPHQIAPVRLRLHQLPAPVGQDSGGRGGDILGLEMEDYRISIAACDRIFPGGRRGIT